MPAIVLGTQGARPSTTDKGEEDRLRQQTTKHWVTRGRGEDVLTGVSHKEDLYGKVTFEQSPEGSEGTNYKAA